MVGSNIASAPPAYVFTGDSIWQNAVNNDDYTQENINKYMIPCVFVDEELTRDGQKFVSNSPFIDLMESDNGFLHLKNPYLIFLSTRTNYPINLGAGSRMALSTTGGVLDKIQLLNNGDPI